MPELHLLRSRLENKIFVEEVKNSEKHLPQAIRAGYYIRINGGTPEELTRLLNQTRKWEDKKYLYPIPTADLLINPKLTQNPGW